MSAKPVTRFFTVSQVAELLAVSTRSVRRWIATGELLAHKFRPSSSGRRDRPPGFLTAASGRLNPCQRQS